ncbi:MAG: DNA-3-methyladenine glycosylase 2 family protein [Chloroflexi bacterium]|nr:DNA-3-methyladenine glycosylase 2 family protein [Chloroflexota bacterium]
MNFEINLPEFFNLDTTMDSEQCPGSFFFWKREDDERYSRTCSYNNAFYKLTIHQAKNKLLAEIKPELGKRLAGDEIQHATDLLRWQFRFDDDFYTLLQQVNQWSEIKKLFEIAPGLRLMRDVDLFERVCDSICSQNTSIQHLNRMMHNLATKLGHKVEFVDNSVSFILPRVGTVAEADLSVLQECSMGYRAKYLLKSAQILSINYNEWNNLKELSKEDAEEKVRILPGVGPKVGSLILMFGMGRTDVFPVDVWVQRGLQHLYNWEGSLEKLKQQAEQKFGNSSAYINNYIFYVFRKGLLLQ